MRKFLSTVFGLILIAAVISCMFPSDSTENVSVDTTHSEVNNTSEPVSSKLEMIMEEGGVVAYSVRMEGTGAPNVLYILLDCNNNKLYRFTQAIDEVFEETISGDINDTFKAGSRKYTFSGSGIDSLHEEYLGHTKSSKNKSFSLIKRDKNEVYRVMNHYDEINPYSEKFTGQIVCIGQYVQENEAKPIEWIALYSNGEKTLLVSKYVLDNREYFVSNGGSVECTWKTSTIRKWLNDEFYKNAFSSKEKKMILTTEINQDGETTRDNVFLLSSTEVKNYFTNVSLKAVSPDSSTAIWWLRSSKDKFKKENVYSGLREIDNDFGDKVLGIRPAIWVNTSTLNQPDK